MTSGFVVDFSGWFGNFGKKVLIKLQVHVSILKDIQYKKQLMFGILRPSAMGVDGKWDPYGNPNHIQPHPTTTTCEWIFLCFARDLLLCCDTEFFFGRCHQCHLHQFCQTFPKGVSEEMHKGPKGKETYPMHQFLVEIIFHQRWNVDFLYSIYIYIGIIIINVEFPYLLKRVTHPFPRVQ